MNILYLSLDEGVPVFGTKGASVHVRSMAAALARCGHDVRVVTRRAGNSFLPSRTESAGGAPAEREYRVQEIAASSPEKTLDEICSIAAAWPADLIYERYSLWGTEGIRAAAGCSIPHLLEVNAPLPEEAHQYRDLKELDKARAAARTIFQGATRVVTVSRELAGYVNRYGVPAHSVHVLPNAVDGRLFEKCGRPERCGRPPAAPEIPSRNIRPNASDDRGRDTLTLCFCGSLKPWHGIDDLVRILMAVRNRVPEARLVVIGDGPGRERIEQGARAANALDAVTFMGPVEHAAVPEWLSTCDIGLAPYPRLESFYFSPLKVFEYMAAGLPVVASRQGDLPLLVHHGVTGLLYEAGDIAAAAGLVLDLHADRERAGRIGARARTEVLAHHTWDARAATITAWAGELRAGSRVAG